MLFSSLGQCRSKPVEKPWTHDEMAALENGIKKYGDQAKKIMEEFLPSRTV